MCTRNWVPIHVWQVWMIRMTTPHSRKGPGPAGLHPRFVHQLQCPTLRSPNDWEVSLPKVTCRILPPGLYWCAPLAQSLTQLWIRSSQSQYLSPCLKGSNDSCNVLQIFLSWFVLPTAMPKCIYCIYIYIHICVCLRVCLFIYNIK